MNLAQKKIVENFPISFEIHKSFCKVFFVVVEKG